MNWKAAFFIARRSMKGREGMGRRDSTEKGRGNLKAPGGGLGGAIVAIGISIVPLILVMTVSDGMIEGITRRYIETKSHHMQIGLPLGPSAEIAAAAIPALKALPGVAAAYLERDGTAVAVSGSRSHAILARALPADYFLDPGTARFLTTLEGNPIPSGSRGMVIGSALAQALAVGLGDLLTVVTPGAEADDTAQYLGTGYAPRLSTFRITGIVSAGYRDLDALWAFISPEAGDRILSYPSSSAFIGLKVANPYSGELGGEIRNKVGDAMKGLYPQWFEGYLVRTWPELEQSLYANFGTTKTMLLFIMAIILLVAAVNLGSALSTFVAERTMEIAVLRSLGASDSMIGGIFTGAGLLAGAVGTILGVGAGLLLAVNINPLIRGAEWIVNAGDATLSRLAGRPALPLKLLDPGYYLEAIPLVVDFKSVAMVVAASLVLSGAVSLLPSRRAVRISVQDLIRKS